MTIELSRFVHSFDDALAELGAGHHGRPDPLVCWTTLELVLVRRRTGPAGDGKDCTGCREILAKPRLRNNKLQMVLPKVQGVQD
jgi:hypothetical protein